MHKVVLALFLLWDGEDNTDAGSLKNLQSRRFHSPVVHFVVRHLCVCEYVGGWMCVCVCVDARVVRVVCGCERVSLNEWLRTTQTNKKSEKDNAAVEAIAVLLLVLCLLWLWRPNSNFPAVLG